MLRFLWHLPTKYSFSAFLNSELKPVHLKMNLPRATLALVTSWLTKRNPGKHHDENTVGNTLEYFGNKSLKTNLPRATLAMVVSWLIQKETRESIMVRILWEYFGNTLGILWE